MASRGRPSGRSRNASMTREWCTSTWAKLRSRWSILVRLLPIRASRRRSSGRRRNAQRPWLDLSHLGAECRRRWTNSIRPFRSGKRSAIETGKPRRSTILARFTMQSGDRRKALDYYERGLAIAEAAGRPPGRGHHAQQHWRRLQSNWGTGRRHWTIYDQALRLERVCGRS